VAEAIVGKSQCFGQHPAFAVVLAEEGINALVAVTTAGADLRFKIVEGDECQDRMAKFWVLVLVDTPAQDLWGQACYIAITPRSNPSLTKTPVPFCPLPP